MTTSIMSFVGLISSQHRLRRCRRARILRIRAFIISMQFSRYIRHCSCDSKPFGLFHHGLSPYQAVNPRLLPHKCVASVYFPLGTSQCLRGDGEIRTHDPLLARQVLSQLSYTPVCQDCVAIVTGRVPLERTWLSTKVNPSSHLLSHIVSNAVPSAA